MAQSVECRTANQAARVRILAKTNGFFLSVFLTHVAHFIKVTSLQVTSS